MMTSYIIFAFVSGFLLATVIFWQINQKQRQDWQAEYRRLMGGIDRVGYNILMRMKDQHSSNQNYRLLEKSATMLKQLHDGETL